MDEVDSLLTFSALFLTVITLFIGTSSNALQPDNAKTTVDVLYIISRQLNGTQTVAPVEPFHSELFDVIQNSFLFGSLLLCLISSGLGLWVKEWLREYMLDLPYSPRELVHVQQYRHQGLRRWGMRRLVAMISFLLQLAVALFSVGMTMFTLKLDITLYWVLIGLSGLWTVLTWGTAFFPAFSTHCPYKSPLSRALYRLVRPLYILTWSRTDGMRRKMYESMVDRERRTATEDGTKLELEALEYINREYWGHEMLPKINQCFKDVAPTGAKETIERIIVERMAKDQKTFANRAGGMGVPSDKDVLELLHIWGGIYRTTHKHSTGQDMDDEQLWTAFKACVGKPDVLAEVALAILIAPCRSSDSMSGSSIASAVKAV
ncbi:hypothetical protein OH76DRAFT_1236360 [Lentinus brumalis]|uniref:DUF6535 domain-containing protein n=1 Tax=Lentinus brumalis TaxID=2498619 RepID=A0A371CSA2_9APHY|nr:hypothetical protein OH76DRAFT_1236360 [Polyporus brumalis]